MERSGSEARVELTTWVLGSAKESDVPSMKHHFFVEQGKQSEFRIEHAFCSTELFELMESLILAQDERWRRA
jgi:hypothetical protein